MLRTRIIPCLLLSGDSLVKTIRFQDPRYIGDPINTCKIFNELEVDELVILDISASKENKEPNYECLTGIANECFMPVAYGGGISSVSIAEKIFKLGFEKVIINTYSFKNPDLITELSQKFGSQSIIVSIDVKKNIFGRQECYVLSGSLNIKKKAINWAKKLEELGAGEILLTSIDKEGTWKGFDIDLIRSITDSVHIPVIAHGGAGQIEHISEAIKQGNASAVGLGSMVVYQKQGMGVLINFPDQNTLRVALQ